MKQETKLLMSIILMVLVASTVFVFVNDYFLGKSRTIYTVYLSFAFAAGIAGIAAMIVSLFVNFFIYIVTDSPTTDVINVSASAAALAGAIACAVAGIIDITNTPDGFVTIVATAVSGFMVFIIRDDLSSFLTFDKLKISKAKATTYVTIEIVIIWGIMMTKVFLF